MPNQHTKRKEREAAAAAKKATNAYKHTQKTCGEKPEIHVHALDLSEVFAHRFPKMNAADEKAKTQPHFTLLAQDNFCTVLVRSWIDLAIQHGVSEDKIIEAKALLKRIQEWRTEHPLACKKPD